MTLYAFAAYTVVASRYVAAIPRREQDDGGEFGCLSLLQIVSRSSGVMPPRHSRLAAAAPARRATSKLSATMQSRILAFADDGRLFEMR